MILTMLDNKTIEERINFVDSLINFGIQMKDTIKPFFNFLKTNNEIIEVEKQGIQIQLIEQDDIKLMHVKKDSFDLYYDVNKLSANLNVALIMFPSSSFKSQDKITFLIDYAINAIKICEKYLK